ncbi:hypothetical protein JRI60_48010 [Archangium violaceum]|uniref:hypothetical protein n=1 Tax=Archangium violaceum TaxID=83451 RepID=UPI00194F6B68|nr:hypothetical protein [Archangium violaceum]QRN96654.1 hypothetical protein JRI60_48010 [Archangium violaceum]
MARDYGPYNRKDTSKMASGLYPSQYITPSPPGAVRYASTLLRPPHREQAKTSSVVFPQTTKPAGEGNGVLDGDVLTRHHDALDEQAHQPLPALEVERVEPLTHSRGKGLQLRFPFAQPLLFSMLRQEKTSTANVLRSNPAQSSLRAR